MDGKWALESPGLTNLLAGTNLKSPVPPFGGTGDFDISSHGICFVAKDLEINPARYTKTDLYYVPVKSFIEKPSAPQIVKTGHLVGYSIAPTFNKDGEKIAFLRMKNMQYEADKTRLLLIPDVSDLSNVEEFYETSDGQGGWDVKPDWITWSHDEKELYVGAERHGRVVLWKLPSSPAEAKELPVPIHEDGSVSDAKLLGDGPSLLISSKSRIESSLYTILDPTSGSLTELSSSSKSGKSFGLNKAMCGSIWYQGSLGYNVHALVTLPSDFDASKKYPLAFLIHGGPQGAWMDDWSTRWNPAIFAEQGYVVVSPNPTGSTGYGQQHTDAIKCNWGGNPYEDLVLCFEHLEKHVNYIDTSRAVALGASYGGYMISTS
jgi:dipeptidyl aminopeptidase/acylaminoacyl peptidase